MKPFIVVLIGFLLLSVGYLLWTRPTTTSPESSPSIRKQTEIVEARDIEFNVTVSGNIEPAEQVSVRPEINGRIASLSADIGDKVKKGTVLFTLDDKELQNQLSSSETDIDRAKLELEKAERNFTRNKEMFADELISKEAFDDSHTDLELARNTLVRANKALLIIQEKLSKTRINAPFDCTVLLRPVSVGQAVSGSGGVGGGTEVLAIADLNRMVINAHVNQVDVIRLKVGQPVAVTVEAITGLKVKGSVERIAPQAIVRNGIKGFSARILLDEIDPRVQPGMTANLTIPVHSSKGVTAVPLAAVFTKLEDNWVYLKSGSENIRQPVEIGAADYQYVEILSGLSPGDVVWLEEPPIRDTKPE